MRRFFFDVCTTSGPLPDYEGQEFHLDEDVRKYAEHFVLKLQASDLFVWAGATAEVRNGDGKKLFSIPVQESDCVDASPV
jgi:hypothetical protein